MKDTASAEENTIPKINWEFLEIFWKEQYEKEYNDS